MRWIHSRTRFMLIIIFQNSRHVNVFIVLVSIIQASRLSAMNEFHKWMNDEFLYEWWIIEWKIPLIILLLLCLLLQLKLLVICCWLDLNTEMNNGKRMNEWWRMKNEGWSMKDEMSWFLTYLVSSSFEIRRNRWQEVDMIQARNWGVVVASSIRLGLEPFACKISWMCMNEHEWAWMRMN